MTGEALSVDAATRAGADLEGAPAEEILGWALHRFHPRLVVACSMADAVLVHLATRLRADVPVLFVDTGYHFAETLGTLAAVHARYPVRLQVARPERSVREQDLAEGPRLFERDPDRCCRLRKVAPFDRALTGYLAWASGLRREESPTRREVRVVEWDDRRGLVKVNPLAGWTARDLDRYVHQHDVPVNPLLHAGYGSIGCAPCTRPLRPGESARAGRWAGTGKVECGLHS